MFTLLIRRKNTFFFSHTLSLSVSLSNTHSSSHMQQGHPLSTSLFSSHFICSLPLSLSHTHTLALTCSKDTHFPPLYSPRTSYALYLSLSHTHTRSDDETRTRTFHLFILLALHTHVHPSVHTLFHVIYSRKVEKFPNFSQVTIFERKATLTLQSVSGIYRVCRWFRLIRSEIFIFDHLTQFVFRGPHTTHGAKQNVTHLKMWPFLIWAVCGPQDRIFINVNMWFYSKQFSFTFTFWQKINFLISVTLVAKEIFNCKIK